MRCRSRRLLIGVMLRTLTLLGFALNVQAAEVSVAVASNFTAPMRKIAEAFEQETGHRAVLSSGSTGGFHVQINNGAPFEVLLAADEETPLKVERGGLGVEGSRFTYAIGRLVLWSQQPGFVDDKGDVLRRGKFERIAIANPKLAPYGAAAAETLTRLGLLKDVQPRLVQGENIAQTYQFVATGNVPLGFVAMSQVIADGKISRGSAWIVPAEFHTPIRQDAILLTKGKDAPAAISLMRFLRSDKARALIRSFGYDV
ncbi:MAG: molybdate ABC transporter substrate-binding protein [Burkholderiales bacterium 28-67-8]|nr:MAG: molybdate ABC transporter substrate-binding protein [Burkholderiales bacterium 28-67-8]